MTRRTLHIAAYGARVTVTAESRDDVCDRLAGLLPPDAVGPVRDDTHVRYAVHGDAPGGPEPGPRYRVTRDGTPCFEADTAQDVAARLRSLVDLDLAVHARDGLAVHAGAVAWRGHGILIPGRSRTGKSSLVAALVRLGATYYSDELAVLDDEGRLHPYARPLCLRDESTGADRWIAPAELGVVGQAPVPVSLVVSTAYREDAGWEPAVITGARAAIPLIDNAVLAREDPGRTLRVASVLAPTLVTLQGARPAAQIVAAAILRFADDMAAGRPGPEGARDYPR